MEKLCLDKEEALLKAASKAADELKLLNSTKHPSSGTSLSNVKRSLDSNSLFQNSPSGVA